MRKNAINVQNVITYDVVLRVDNSQLRLLPGMTANVRILTNTVKDTLKVPNAALRFKAGGTATAGRRERGTQTVYLLNATGSPRPIQVTTSLSDGNFTGISSSELHDSPLNRVTLAGVSSWGRPINALMSPRRKGVWVQI